MRALLGDSCRRSQQPAANAIAGTVISTGGVLSYATAFLDLTSLEILRIMGANSHFSILCIITSIVLAVSVAATCLGVREPSFEDHGSGRQVVAVSLTKKLKHLFTSFRRLPKQVRQVCMVQFFSWMGWFPFLFYITTYIGDICKRSFAAASGKKVKN